MRLLSSEDKQLMMSRILLIVVLTSAVVIERLDVALSGAHSAGHTAGGFGDIATPIRLTDPQGAVDIAAGWASLPEVAGKLVWTHGAADLILMLALTVWLAWLYQSRQTSPASWSSFTWILCPFPPSSRPSPAGQQISEQTMLARVFSFGSVLWLYLIADLAEDATLILTWSDLSVPEAYLIAFASLIKWTLLGIAGLLLLARYRLPSATERPKLALRQAILALRGQLLISGVLIALMLALTGDMGRQIDDVLAVAAARPWTSAFAATLAAVAASILLSLGGMVCLRAYEDPPSLPVGGVAASCRRETIQKGMMIQGHSAPESLGPRRIQAWLAAVFVLICLILIVIGFTLVSRDNRAAVLTWVIPLGIVALLLLPAWFAEVYAGKGESWYETPACPEQLSSAPGSSLPAPAPSASNASAYWPNWVIPVVADIPMFVLLLAIARAATTTWAAGFTPTALLVWELVLAVLWLNTHCITLAWAGQRWNIQPFISRISWWHPLSIGAALLIAAVFLPRVLGDWVDFYQWLGTPAILMLFAAVLGLILTGATLLSDRFRPGGILEACHVRRLPIFTVMVVWGLLASTVDVAGAYYVVRTTGDQPVRPPAAEAFEKWANAFAQEGGEQVPLVFVAAAGGGIRSAYWTRLGMDCVFGTACGNTQDNTGRVFLGSGVSGGSLGLASTRSRQDSAGGDGGHEVDKVLGGDFIAPALAAFLFVDQPNAFLRWPVHGVNRADTLETAWEGADSGLTRALGEGEAFPRLVLNSTSVEDGCRLEISEIGTVSADRPSRRCTGTVGGLADDTGPGSSPARDAFAHLCEGEDGSLVHKGVALSTAALMSARFPYVSPAGGLRGCAPRTRTFALDGGIVDNSGGTAVLEVWRDVAARVGEHNLSRRSDPSKTCIVPRLVVFDSGQVAGVQPPADNRPPQLTAPLGAALGVFHRRSSTPLAQTALAIREAADQARATCALPATEKDEAAVIVIAPHEQPGPGIPLGWTLSSESRTQMRCQMGGAQLVPPDSMATCARTGGDLDDVKTVWTWFPPTS